MQAEVELLYFGKGDDPGRGKKVDEVRILGSKNLLCSPIFFLVYSCDFETVLSANFRVKMLIFVL